MSQNQYPPQQAPGTPQRFPGSPLNRAFAPVSLVTKRFLNKNILVFLFGFYYSKNLNKKSKAIICITINTTND
jgi:hypothetical protein